MKVTNMRPFLIATLLASISLLAKSQNNTSQLDTMIYYSVNLIKGSAIDCKTFDSKLETKYFVDCQEVSKTVYDKYATVNKKLKECAPCYLMTLNKNDSLIREGPQYTDCSVGTIIEYYPGGKVKSKKQYKENTSGKWNGNWEKKYCNIANGTWTYYNESGNITKTEVYKNGALVK